MAADVFSSAFLWSANALMPDPGILISLVPTSFSTWKIEGAEFSKLYNSDHTWWRWTVNDVRTQCLKQKGREEDATTRILFPSLFYDNRTSTKKKNRMASFRSTHSNQACPSVMDIPFLFLKSHHTKQFSNIRCPRLCFVSWKLLPIVSYYVC